jgi:hypothetical protein
MRRIGGNVSQKISSACSFERKCSTTVVRSHVTRTPCPSSARVRFHTPARRRVHARRYEVDANDIAQATSHDQRGAASEIENAIFGRRVHGCDELFGHMIAIARIKKSPLAQVCW